MYIEVTSETFRETVVYFLLVRHTMAFRALGYEAVLRMMTGCATDLAMLARRFLPGRIDPGMTRSASLYRNILVIGYKERLMYRVAFCTFRQFLALVMGLMAIEAGGFITV